MEIRKIDSVLCHEYRETISRYIYKSVVNSRFMDSYTEEDARAKCGELEHYLEQDKAVVYGAFDGDQMAGFIWAYDYPFREDRNRLYISIIYLDPSFRGQHIGQQLIAAVRTYAADNGYRALFLHTEGHNTGAQAFYAAMGFAVERLQLVEEIDK